MRPPHYTGEDRLPQQPHQRGGQASMRPPHYTGEDLARGREHRAVAAGASMRPPHYTGEDAVRKAVKPWTTALLQ